MFLKCKLPSWPLNGVKFNPFLPVPPNMRAGPVAVEHWNATAIRNWANKLTTTPLVCFGPDCRKPIPESKMSAKVQVLQPNMHIV